MTFATQRNPNLTCTKDKKTGQTTAVDDEGRVFAFTDTDNQVVLAPTLNGNFAMRVADALNTVHAAPDKPKK